MEPLVLLAPNPSLFTGPGTNTYLVGESQQLCIDPGPDGDMTQYMESLQRIRELRPSVIHPGHGPRVGDAAALIDDYIVHRREREEQVERAARARGGPVRPADLVPEIYAGYPEGLYVLAARSVEAHLDKLAREGRAMREGASDGPLYTVR